MRVEAAFVLVFALGIALSIGEPSVWDHLQAILSQYSGLEIPKDSDQ